MPQFDVLCLGELNPDLILSGIRAEGPRLGTEQAFSDIKLTLGSSTAIACVIMQRLGLQTAMAACIGDDDYGRFCRDALVTEGVDVGQVRVLPDKPTGVTLSLAYPKDRMLLTTYGAMTKLTADMVDAGVLSNVRHIHVGSFFIQKGLQPGLAALFEAARKQGISTSLDTGWDPEETWGSPELDAVLAETDVLLPNEVEFERITATADRTKGFTTLHERGVREVALKLGGAGAVYSGPDGVHTHPGFAATPIDTTGAGDSFNAGYVFGRLKGEAPVQRLARGNACGALTVAAVGGTSGVLNIDAVETILAGAAKG